MWIPKYITPLLPLSFVQSAVTTQTWKYNSNKYFDTVYLF